MFRCENCGELLEELDVVLSGAERYHSRSGWDGLRERCGPVLIDLDEESIIRWSQSSHEVVDFVWERIDDSEAIDVSLSNKPRNKIDGLTRLFDFSLRCTSVASPEQYNVYWRGIPVGYLRLRHGVFRADAPLCGEDTVFMAEPAGHYLFDDRERENYLVAALESIRRKMFDVAKAD